MTVTRHLNVDGDLREQCWKAYHSSFDRLRSVAVQRHVMYQDEFDQVMGDERVTKYLAVADSGDAAGEVVGMATMTDQIQSMPLVSPEYFAAKWPDLYREGRVKYIGFLGVTPRASGTGVFASIIGELAVDLVDCVVVYDMCTFNRDRLHIDRAIYVTTTTFVPYVATEVIDAQSYITLDFIAPEAAPAGAR